jgi:hypothetical protein
MALGRAGVNEPQKTPTICAPLSSTRFSGIFGIPATKPITRKRPSHAIERKAASEKSPPTGS